MKFYLASLGCAKNLVDSELMMGRLVKVKILKTFSHSLWGKTDSKEPTDVGLRGEKSYVT